MKIFEEIFLDIDTKVNSDLDVVRLGYNAYSPGESHRIDRQYYHTLVFVTSGHGSLNVDGQVLRLKQNDIIYIPADTLARCTADSSDTLELSFCSFTGKRSNGVMYAFFDSAPNKYYISSIDTEHYAEIIGSATEMEPGLASSYLRATAYCSLFLQIFQKRFHLIFISSIRRAAI